MKMPGDVRWTVLGLLFLGGMINYLDRSAIGVAAPFLAKQLSLSPSELGWVFSVFFFGYAAFCFVGGYASDRIGPRNVFAIAAVVWSVFCGLTAFVFSYTSLLIVRVIFGMGEGPYGSATNKLISNWFPRRQQGSAVGWANAGTPLGGAIAGPVVGFIALAYGWRVSFIVIALIGLCWAIAWMLLVTDRPEQNVRVSAAERAAIAADAEVPTVGPSAADADVERLALRPPRPARPAAAGCRPGRSSAAASSCRRRPRCPASPGPGPPGTGWRSSTRLPRESWWISTASAIELISGMPRPPIGQAVDGGRLDRRYPVAVVDDLDAQRAGFGPQGQLHDPGAPRPVGVADGVRRRLVDGQHHAGGLVVGQRERGEPARQLATDHRQLRRVGGPAAVHELDSAGSRARVVLSARLRRSLSCVGRASTCGLRASSVHCVRVPGPRRRKRRPPRPPRRWSGRRSWPSTRRSAARAAPLRRVSLCDRHRHAQ